MKYFLALFAVLVTTLLGKGPNIVFVFSDEHADEFGIDVNRLAACGGSAGHGFFNYGKENTPSKYFILTVEEMDRFLESLGYLEALPEA